jgi:hypothetical protein
MMILCSNSQMVAPLTAAPSVVIQLTCGDFWELVSMDEVVNEDLLTLPFSS